MPSYITFSFSIFIFIFTEQHTNCEKTYPSQSRQEAPVRKAQPGQPPKVSSATLPPPSPPPPPAPWMEKPPGTPTLVPPSPPGPTQSGLLKNITFVLDGNFQS